jgi:hypothetical protein
MSNKKIVHIRGKSSTLNSFKSPAKTKTPPRNTLVYDSTMLINDVAKIIDEAKNHVTREYNSAQAFLCWMIGKRIDEEILKTERANYGEAVVVSLAEHLSLAYGKGYSRANIFRIIKFAKQFPDRKIVSTLSRQLSWSHFVIICSIDDNFVTNKGLSVTRILVRFS